MICEQLINLYFGKDAEIMIWVGEDGGGEEKEKKKKKRKEKEKRKEKRKRENHALKNSRPQIILQISTNVLTERGARGVTVNVTGNEVSDASSVSLGKAWIYLSLPSNG